MVKEKHPLRAYRESRGLSQEALAAELGVTGMTIYRWEKGRRIPQRKDWSRIRLVTGINPAEFAAFAEPA
jgi:transcriptional regulator with XRE-family HTH domain